MSAESNNNGVVKLPRWLWACIATLSGTLLACSIGWASYITTRVVSIETKVEAFERMVAQLDEIRIRSGGFSNADLSVRLTRIEVVMERLSADVLDLRRRPEPKLVPSP